MGRELGPLAPATLNLIVAYFQGHRSIEAFLPTSRDAREKHQTDKELQQRAEADERNAEQRAKIEASRAQLQASTSGRGTSPRPSGSSKPTRSEKSPIQSSSATGPRESEGEEEGERMKRRRRAWLGYPEGASSWGVDLEAKVDEKTGVVGGEAAIAPAPAPHIMAPLRLEVEDLEEDEW